MNATIPDIALGTPLITLLVVNKNMKPNNAKAPPMNPNKTLANCFMSICYALSFLNVIL